MKLRLSIVLLLTAVSAFAASGSGKKADIRFLTSDRCLACHNLLTTLTGQDVSIGYEWRASLMSNSARDPYWQASVRREIIDHPESQAHIEDGCSDCHMPITRYEARLEGRLGEVFTHLPFKEDRKHGREAADGVDCSVCHQISKEGLGTRQSFNGGFILERPGSADLRPEYGPYEIQPGQQRIMRTSTGGFQPTLNQDHIQKSELCATCHTLFTTALGPGGKPVGVFPEQMPYPEWLHSGYRDKQSCQSCHMPDVEAPITRVFGMPRRLSRHSFLGANFFMQRMLNEHRDELEVAALPQELSNAAEANIAFLRQTAARIAISDLRVVGDRLEADISVENLGGHKLPTAYPSRRAWLHVTMRDSNDRVLFESGALRSDGSIVGNDNDADPLRFEPHYTQITSSEQVQIYEDIIGDSNGNVTTALLRGVRYLKDNRLLPRGFEKSTADRDVAVVGGAAGDLNFTDTGHRIRYSVALPRVEQGPFRVEAELWYQPIGYRWAHNLKSYQNASWEGRRFPGYFESMAGASGLVIARAAVGK
jgi:hypothetical protein